MVGLILKAEHDENGTLSITNSSQTSDDDDDDNNYTEISDYCDMNEIDEDTEVDTEENEKDENKKNHSQRKIQQYQTNTSKIQRTKTKFSTKINQDIQREYEENSLILINAFLSRKISCKKALTVFTNKVIASDNSLCKMVPQIETSDANISSYRSTSSLDKFSDDSLSLNNSTTNSSVRILHSRNTPIWNSYNPLPGIFVKIESAWRDRSNIPVIIHACPACFSSNIVNKRSQPFTHLKICTQCHDPCLQRKNMYSWVSRRKKQLPEICYNTGVEKRIWIFDARSQELDYLSAAYKPLPGRNEKFLMQQLNLVWENLSGLEKYWTAFLELFNENESPPNNELTQ